MYGGMYAESEAFALTRKKFIIIASILIAATALIIWLSSNPFKTRIKYTVTYDCDGGTMAVEETVVVLDEAYSLPSPTRENYKFVGWYLDGEPFEAMGVWTIEDDVTLKAKWELRDDYGFIFEEVSGGYRVVNYKGVVKERIVVPDTYNGVSVVDVSNDAFLNLKKFLDNGEISNLRIYIPKELSDKSTGIAFDNRVEIAVYDAADNGEITFMRNDSGYVVVEYVGGVKPDIIIPSEYKGLPVVSVKSDAFNSLKAVVEADESVTFVHVYIPDTVMNMKAEVALIDKLCFAVYSEISENGVAFFYNEDTASVVGFVGEYGESLTLPYEYNGKKVTGVASYSFWGTGNRISNSSNEYYVIKIPEIMTEIGTRVFENCAGVRLMMYYSDNGREIASSPSVVFDWLSVATLDNTCDAMIDVLCNLGPSLDLPKGYPIAHVYVRFILNGGVVIEMMEAGVDDDGNPWYVPTELSGVMAIYNKQYTLPTPEREGYIFDGWYCGEKYIPNEGERWPYHKYVAIEAHWIEAEKEG